MKSYILFESALGYSIFERKEFEEIGSESQEIQKAINDYERFSLIVKLKSFFPFKTSEKALHNITLLNSSKISEDLEDFLKQNFPSKKKNKNIHLGICDQKLGSELLK